MVFFISLGASFSLVQSVISVAVLCCAVLSCFVLVFPKALLHQISSAVLESRMRADKC